MRPKIKLLVRYVVSHCSSPHMQKRTKHLLSILMRACIPVDQDINVSTCSIHNNSKLPSTCTRPSSPRTTQRTRIQTQSPHTQQPSAPSQDHSPHHSLQHTHTPQQRLSPTIYNHTLPFPALNTHQRPIRILPSRRLHDRGRRCIAHAFIRCDACKSTQPAHFETEQCAAMGKLFEGLDTYSPACHREAVNHLKCRV